MKADVFYSTAPGRFMFKVLQKFGFFKLTSWFLCTKTSRLLIPGYIKKYEIDMKPFDGQAYASFADFFDRKRIYIHYVIDPAVLISPCEGLLSVYPVTENLSVPMKGSVYALSDLVPDPKIAELFQNGVRRGLLPFQFLSAKLHQLAGSQRFIVPHDVGKAAFHNAQFVFGHGLVLLWSIISRLTWSLSPVDQSVKRVLKIFFQGAWERFFPSRYRPWSAPFRADRRFLSI